MFMRFSVTSIEEYSGCPMGVFCAAYDLRDSSDTNPELSDRVKQMLRWFHNELPAPSDYGVRIDQRAVFWFRADALKYVSEVWKLVHALREGGYIAYKTTSTRPGKIVFQDDYQIAAIPFRDMRRRL